MGFDCGFDIFPRLTAADTVEKHTYKCFLDEVLAEYGDSYDEKASSANGKILTTPADPDHDDRSNVVFMIGECPCMPYNSDHCNYFLRFSSKVSGRLTAPAEPYITGVHKIAKKHFGSRVHFWHEMHETGDERQCGCYNWQQVRDAKKELEELTGEPKHYSGKNASDPSLRASSSQTPGIPMKLQDSLPAFADLPDEDSIDYRYYETSDGFLYSPRIHWCFLAEIIQVNEFLRVRLWVQDKKGAKVWIHLYTDGRGTEISEHLMRAGNTVAVLYADQHGFMDLSVGIRLEQLDALKIFPASLEKMLHLIEGASRKKPACNQCGATPSNLSKCAGCGIARYCNKDCQRLAWKESHKSDCKLIRSEDFRMLLKLGERPFESLYTFSSQK